MGTEECKKLVSREMLCGVLLAFPEDKRADSTYSFPWDDANDVLNESWWKRIEDAEPS